MRPFVLSVKNSIKENEGIINISVNNYLEKMKNDNSKLYLRHCFKQAIEYANLQNNASIETLPLIQFYSLLNLSKVFIIINNGVHGVQLSELESMFSSHGATCSNENDIMISKKGTFVELAKIQNKMKKDSYSLLELYKRLPDLYEYLPMVFSNNQTDFVPVQYWKTFMYETGFINSSLYFHWLVVDEKTFYEQKLNNKGFVIRDTIETKIVFSKENMDDSLDDIICFDCNGNLFIDISISNEDELLSIYLIFLNYSSLVRYRPNNWSEKINSKELVIIEKMLRTMFVKFWAYISRELAGRYEILI
ncbi:MAG: YaaC family protein [Treponema sp.]